MSARYILQVGIISLFFAVSLTPIVVAQTAQPASSPTLEDAFRNPPDSAKPYAWWHWLSANVTEQGITADLEWMHRVGIGGFQMFDGDLGAPLFVDKPVIWMSPEWQSAWRHSAAEADRLHLDMAMAASGGWSETAGPWVKPSQGMKRYVWSETHVEGPSHFTGKLQQPPKNLSNFQDLIPAPRVPGLVTKPDLTLPGAKPQPDLPERAPTPELYSDEAVVAFPVIEEEVDSPAQKPEITCSCGPIDGSILLDGSYAKAIEIPYSKEDRTAWVQYDYSQAHLVQSVLFGGGLVPHWKYGAIPVGRIEASYDGQQWQTLADLPGPQGAGTGDFPVRTYSIAPIWARHFRVFFTESPLPVRIAELQFLTAPRINYWEAKASFGSYTPREPANESEVKPGEAIDPAKVIDLTSKLRADGSLDWDVPAGKWIILRLGYSLIGVLNHPATPSATGLEVDKLSKKNVQAYVEEYVKMISATAGPYWGKSFHNFLMDSWEAGNENWTEEMQHDFEQRRGYKMTQYLPVLTGRIVGSRAQSEGFLWDFRRTQADLLAENHYQVATDYFKSHGVGLYAEAMGVGMPTVGDGLLNKGKVTAPMGEFWVPLPGQKGRTVFDADVRETSSAAHIYGKPIAATESFTTNPLPIAWGQGPFYLKPLADQAFAQGINRIVWASADQQPFVDDTHKPGMTLGPWGQFYNRNIPWAEQAIAFNQYLARCSFLLQQGKPVSDVAYFYGEDAPATVQFWKNFDPALPAHNDFDFVNADVLLHGATATPSQLQLASGIRYKLLVLPNDLHQLSLPLLRAIHSLVEQGTVLLAPKPNGSPSLADGKDAQAELTRLADDLWGKADEAASGHAFGKGKVYSSRSIEDVLSAEGILPDLAWSAAENRTAPVPYSLSAGNSDENLVFIHRTDGPREIYFVATQKNYSFDLKASFRVTGKTPHLWHPETGETEAVSYSTDHAQTIVPLHFDAEGSVFVLFDGNADLPSRTLPMKTKSLLATVDGSWKLTFPPNWGAPPAADFAKLISWTDSADNGIKYFSGTATYTRQIDALKEFFKPGATILLDLGTVKEIAEVTLNGKPVGGILWKPPFQIDVTSALKPGMNELTVKVTNLWPNRMIGDLQPGVTKTYTWTDFRPFKADSPLLDSGLIGPVTIWKSEDATQSK